ncbi:MULTISPECIES: ArsR/SmtB family transcription factor [Desulfobacter]|uniref:ArsR/SmtB family transcription factor n=1 Tax=Desulfobacter TaxID=2289 RepID=UPI00068C490B|nr:metalloregulator ArsR/SmtB family transcription factor [Desulfobacter vibrioformis]
MDKTLSIIKSMSDKNRLRVLNALLVHNELCACQITEFLGVAGATTSRHLDLMVNAGVLKKRKQGRWIYFQINRDDPSLTPLFRWVENRVEQCEQVKEDLQVLKQKLVISCKELSQKQRERSACANSNKGE